MDATGKPSSGVVTGNIQWPGAYEECLLVRALAADGVTSMFSGQYCTFSILAIPVQVNHVSSCPNDYPLDKTANIAIGVFAFFGFLVALGTAVDIVLVQMPKWRLARMPTILGAGLDTSGGSSGETKPLLDSKKPTHAEEPGTVAKLLISFSLYTNGSKLLSTYQPPGSLTCVHGIRFLSMTWVVLGHTFGAVNGFADNSGPYQKKVYDDFSFGMVANATLSVDTFFLLSGLLVAYLSLKEMNKNKGHLNWPMFYFHRFWRLTPVYMMIIYFNTALTPYLATGPNAPDEDQKAAMRKPCEENWWTNMLYINNLVHGGCEGEGWYLANDMQFYLLSPLIFVPFFYSAWLGGLSAGAFLLATSITPGVLTSIKHFQPSTTAAVDEPIEPGADYMNEYYIKPYCRMGPYIVGLIAGYLLYRCGTKIRMHKVVVVVGWLAATGIAVSSLFGLYDATKFTDREPMEVWQSALYNALGRTAWSISVAWVIIACVWGYGGFVNTILSWGALVPLSRLTYCIYLIHMSAQNTLIRSFNTPFYMNSVNIVMFQFGLLVLCYFIGAIVSLTFESPMMGLEKILLHGNKKKG
ncbi:hypothetical protein BaRGS_00011740 [Batillaria attramentaria]|uniref:Acyltransferase 3 domain-containing protein n=1 Tax=Batillaria attramentaria TaxID=370345 RepID=A0ABD0LDE3_9CAEN